MSFVIVFAGLAAVLLGLLYIKKSTPNDPRHH